VLIFPSANFAEFLLQVRPSSNLVKFQRKLQVVPLGPMAEVEKLRQQVEELRQQVETLTNDKKCLLTAHNFAAKPQILANNNLQVQLSLRKSYCD
jgi:thioredoxin-like negative regulator of GroEL